VADADWLVFQDNESPDLLRRIVRRVIYNGTNGAVSVELDHED
jgi:hypothetical protein